MSEKDEPVVEGLARVGSGHPIAIFRVGLALQEYEFAARCRGAASINVTCAV